MSSSNTIQEMESKTVVIYTVYRPHGMYKSFTVRRDIHRSGAAPMRDGTFFIAGPNIDMVRDFLANNLRLSKIDRLPSDAPEIIETWI